MDMLIIDLLKYLFKNEYNVVENLLVFFLKKEYTVPVEILLKNKIDFITYINNNKTIYDSEYNCIHLHIIKKIGNIWITSKLEHFNIVLVCTFLIE